MEMKFTASIAKALDTVLALQHRGLMLKLKDMDAITWRLVGKAGWDELRCFPFSRIGALEICETGQRSNGKVGLVRVVAFYVPNMKYPIAMVTLVAERAEGNPIRDSESGIGWVVGRIEYFNKYDSTLHRGTDLKIFDVEVEGPLSETAIAMSADASAG